MPRSHLRTRLFGTCLLFLVTATGQVTANDPWFEPRRGLFTGGVPDQEQLSAFAARGGGTVIDLRSADEIDSDDAVAASARALELDYVRLPVVGSADLTPARIERLRSALDNSRGLVLLHAVSSDRAGAMLALMAHQEEGLSRRAAMELGRRAGLTGLEAEVERQMRRGTR